MYDCFKDSFIVPSVISHSVNPLFLLLPIYISKGRHFSNFFSLKIFKYENMSSSESLRIFILI